MLIIFLLVYLSRQYRTSAAPITDPGPSIYDVPIFIRDDSTDACAGRTVWDILWSCLATTFAVTWVSVHPNVPFGIPRRDELDGPEETYISDGASAACAGGDDYVGVQAVEGGGDDKGAGK